MITVTISINGNVIYARSAINKTPSHVPKDGKHKNTYELDDGSEIFHSPKDGAVKLSKKMLDTIMEVQ